MTIRDWAVRLARTFISAAIAAVPTLNVANVDAATLKGIALAAGIAGVNAVVIALQKWLPFTPDPR
jgi:hypothetical protein